MRNNNISLKRSAMRGSVSIELALLMIPLIVLAFGVAEFGRAMYQYNTLAKTVRDATRLLSQHSPNDAINYPVFEAQAKCLAVYGSTNCSAAQSLLPGLTTGMVTAVSKKITSEAGTNINLVTVTVTGYSFNFIFNPLVFFGNSDTTIPFGPIQSTMRQP